VVNGMDASIKNWGTLTQEERGAYLNELDRQIVRDKAAAAEAHERNWRERLDTPAPAPVENDRLDIYYRELASSVPATAVPTQNWTAFIEKRINERLSQFADFLGAEFAAKDSEIKALRTELETVKKSAALSDNASQSLRKTIKMKRDWEGNLIANIFEPDRNAK
jgi:hypothetical protein